ncbi:DUF1003 domain-containing protein [Candidatus Parcubacteria bacterium]|nr:DUF1003 domain-containing protein [Candidatus Parcubacteria bacterium]
MEYKHNPPSLGELRHYWKTWRDAATHHQEDLSTSERFAVVMHKSIGSLTFFFLLFVWTIAWLGWNIFAPVELRFDPAPAFVIWLFASNIMQLIFLPIIMVGQNIQGRAAERRAQLDFEINKKAEQEVEAIIAHLENQNELLLEIMRKIDRR